MYFDPSPYDPPGEFMWKTWDPLLNKWDRLPESQLRRANLNEMRSIFERVAMQRARAEAMNLGPGSAVMPVERINISIPMGWHTFNAALKTGTQLILDKDSLDYQDYDTDQSIVDAQVKDLLPEWSKFTPPAAFFYSSQHRRSFRIRIDQLEPYVFDTQALTNVVLPPGYGQSIIEVIDNVINRRVEQGVNILLYGPPGCGKTYTANLLAEHTSRPLLKVDGRDLLEDPRNFERAIGEALKRATAWKAILLFDEADVMLKDRELQGGTATHTATLLRVLEGHGGIVAMTSNRAFEIDDAFASRIHLALPYPALGEEARTVVWQKILEKRDLELEQERVAALAKLELDGRGINMVITNAQSAASSRGERKPKFDDYYQMAVRRTKGITNLSTRPENTEEFRTATKTAL